MANLICNNPVYTVLRNGKVITMSGTSATAIANIAADAVNVVCPPECCITEVPITIDSFDIVVTTAEYTGLSIRATITHGVDTYSTSWEAAAATNTIDLTGLIVEFATFTDGDTICVEYSYNARDEILGCCLTVQTNTYLEDDTYQLSEIVTECEGGTFDLVFQNPDGGVTVDADGEMVVPTLDEDETVYVTYTCDGCVTELLVLGATDTPLGLRIPFNNIVNAPVVDPTNVGQWNTFFDLPTNGTPFTSVVVAGNQVTLFGGGGIALKESLFFPNTAILQIFDDANVVTSLLHSVFNQATSLTDATFDAAITVGVAGWGGAFYGASSLENVSFASATTFINDTAGTFEGTAIVNLTLPSALLLPEAFLKDATLLETLIALVATDLGTNGMQNCAAATLINIPLCVNLGSSPADASVFAGCTNAALVLNIAAVNATNNAGGVHASIAALLIANPTATVNYI